MCPTIDMMTDEAGSFVKRVVSHKGRRFHSWPTLYKHPILFVKHREVESSQMATTDVVVARSCWSFGLVFLHERDDDVVDAAKVAEGVSAGSAFEDLAGIADRSLTDGLFAAKLVIVDSQLHDGVFFDNDSAGAVVVVFGVARGEGVFVSFGLDGGSTCGEVDGNVRASATTCEPLVIPGFTVAFGLFDVKGLDCHFVRSVTTIADCFGDNFAFDDELFNLTEGFEGQLFSCEQRGRNTASSEGTHQVGLEADVCCTVVVTNFDSEGNFSVVFEDKLFADVRTVLFELGCTSVVEFVSHERGGSDFEDDECVGAFATSASFAEFFVFEVFLVVFVSTCGELVALAEADVPYDLLLEMDQINPRMETFDVAIIIGANDVVNPSAVDDESSPIYGMPILNVDKARTVIINKRTMNAGFAGIQNELFGYDNSIMVFGDAKDMLTQLLSDIKEL